MLRKPFTLPVEIILQRYNIYFNFLILKKKYTCNTFIDNNSYYNNILYLYKKDAKICEKH